jgi:hypothetical protein
VIDAAGLSVIELVWLLGWNIADGEWARIGLREDEARELLLNLAKKLEGDPSDAARRSRRWLQQKLMALHRGSFEEIQQNSPFSRRAWRNMNALLRGWTEQGEAGFGRVWGEIFSTGWEAGWERQDPIRIAGDTGDNEKRALEVVGAENHETRAAAEWWYLFYTFGQDWTPELHMTTEANADGMHFSVHSVRIPPDTRRQVWFRLPAGP